MITARAKRKSQVRYANFTGLRLHLDASGLATGVNNSYGQVDGSNNVVSWKGLSTGSILDTFNLNGSGITFNPTTKTLSNNGSGTLRSTSAANTYNFLHYHASGISSLNWTAMIVCKIGTTLKPASVNYGLFGNNGGSSANIGAAALYTNNSTNEDTLQAFVGRGVAASYVGRLVNPGTIPSNQLMVFTVQFEGASVLTRMRYYINDQAPQFPQQLGNSTSLNSATTYPLEIFGNGNGALPLVGDIKEVIITAGTMSYTSVVNTVRQLMNKHNIVRTRTSDYLNKSYAAEIFDINEGPVGSKYHLCGVISQYNETVFSAYSQGGSHLYNANKKLVGRKSIYKGAPYANSFATEGDIYNPGGAESIQDCGGGFDQNGVMHLFTDVLNSGSAGGCIRAHHIYSSDQVTWTNTDITSSLHADGLLAWRMYGNMIHVGGVWIKPYYKLTDQGDITNSAVYVLRSTNGTTWTSVTVKASSGTYINEGSIVHLGGNDLLIICRNEATGEWQQYISADLGLTWTDQGGVTFGETVVSANPLMLKSFTLNGQRVIAAYITNRNNDTAFVIYALPANLISSGPSGWDLDTKLMWWKTSVAPFHLHYGDVVHLDDTLKAVSLYAYDEWPGSGTGTESRLLYTLMPTWHVSLIETQLGI